ncbi:MAG: 5-bromo-4-chloroindolyl phosphate hydrolysis family protein [Aerococcaceae bacterium]|nr:5-bromo-4-chloroindolyl phosphate hydrolysis family protein [Aerococcaceae bacterium]
MYTIYYLFNLGILAFLVIGGLFTLRRAYKYPEKFYRPFIRFAEITGPIIACSAVIMQELTPMARVALAGSIALFCSAILFQKVEQIFQKRWIRFGFILTVGTAGLQILSLFHELTFGQLLVVVIANCIGMAALTYGIAYLIHRKPRRHLPTSKIDHYQQAGLSKKEIEFFREQMAPAKQHILQIEQAFQQTAKLRAIETRHNTVKVAQNFFKDLVQEPQKLSRASHFLYKQLPSLEDLLNKYNEINGHIAKNKQTYLILEKSAATIEQLCENITDQYIQFHQETYNDLMDEIELAQRNLSKDVSTADIDDLLK